MTTNTMECSEARISLGVYVLGGIDPAERAMVDAHLATCQDCREELASLAGLPALLARVSKEEAIALADTGESFDPYAMHEAEPPTELLATVLDLTSARRRRRRWQQAGIGVAAAAVIAVGAIAGLNLGSGSGSGQQPPAQQSLSIGPVSGSMETVSGANGGMTATVNYSSAGWGTALATSVRGIPVGTACKLIVKEADGETVQAGAWVVDSNEGKVWYPGSVGVPSGTITGLEVTVGPHQSIAIPVT